MLAKPPKYSVPSLTVTPDYSTTIIMHSLAFEQEMTQRRMTHDRNRSIFNVFCNQVAIHYREQHEVELMGDNQGSNRSFCRFFKRHTGVTPNDFRQHKE